MYQMTEGQNNVISDPIRIQHLVISNRYSIANERPPGQALFGHRKCHASLILLMSLLTNMRTYHNQFYWVPDFACTED